MLRRGQIVRLIEPGGCPITLRDVFPVGTLYRVMEDENRATRLVCIRLLNPDDFPDCQFRNLSQCASSRRFEIVGEDQPAPESEPEDHYIVFNLATSRVITGDGLTPGHRDNLTYDEAVARARRYFRAINGGDRSGAELHIIPLRSITKVTSAEVIDYRET